MRRTAVLGALTGIAFAGATLLACGDDAAPAPPPTSTSVLDQAPADPPIAPAQPLTSTSVLDQAPSDPPIEESQSIPSDPRISLKVVLGILPSPAATSATLGLAPGAWVVQTGLGQEFEGFDFKGSGMTAGWMARFQPALTPEGIYLSSLAFHATPEDAERTYQYLRGVIGAQVQPEDERESIADAVFETDFGSTASIMVIRQRTVTALVGMLHGEIRDVRAGLRDFARMLALGIDEFSRAQGP